MKYGNEIACTDKKWRKKKWNAKMKRERERARESEWEVVKVCLRIVIGIEIRIAWIQRENTKLNSQYVCNIDEFDLKSCQIITCSIFHFECLCNVTSICY